MVSISKVRLTINKKQRYASIFAVASIIVIALLIRSIHLGADTPDGLSWSAGLYVDEGYKTLTARNMVLFGENKWHPEDTYPGWTGSPLTQWPYYVSFSLFGTEVTSARLVSISFYLILLLGYVVFLRKRYDSYIFYFGLILLSTEATLYFFSRVALFEIPLVAFIYTILLAFSGNRQSDLSLVYQFIILAIATIVLSMYLKPSAVLYMMPVLGATVTLFLFKQTYFSHRTLTLGLSFIAVILVYVMYITHGIWGQRISFNLAQYLYGIAENPLLRISPLLVISGLACAAYSISYHSKLYFSNSYRFSLLWLVIIGPFLLPLFTYHPVRYYVPFVPAYVFLIIEWLQNVKYRPEISERPRLAKVTGLVLLFLTITYCMVALSLHEYIQMRVIFLISAILTFMIFQLCSWNNLQKTQRTVIHSLVICSILLSIFHVGSFLSSPSYASDNIRHRILQVVENDEIISGGWAPFLTLNTPIRALYANTDYNPPSALKVIKPQYFILSNTPTALEAHKIIENDDEIELGDAMDLGQYNSHTVHLFPLLYKGIPTGE